MKRGGKLLKTLSGPGLHCRLKPTLLALSSIISTFSPSTSTQPSRNNKLSRNCYSYARRTWLLRVCLRHFFSTHQLSPLCFFLLDHPDIDVDRVFTSVSDIAGEPNEGNVETGRDSLVLWLWLLGVAAPHQLRHRHRGTVTPLCRILQFFKNDSALRDFFPGTPLQPHRHPSLESAPKHHQTHPDQASSLQTLPTRVAPLAKKHLFNIIHSLFKCAGSTTPLYTSFTPHTLRTPSHNIT